MKTKLDKLKEHKNNYWKLLKAEECFHYPSDPDQDMENYKSLCRRIEQLESELKDDVK